MFFERQESGERVVSVSMNLVSESKRQDQDEFEGLIISAGGTLVGAVSGNRLSPNSKTFPVSGHIGRNGL